MPTQPDCFRRRAVFAGRAAGWCAVALGLALAIRPAAAEPPPPQGAAVDYAIVITGTEMLEGAYADAHTVFLTRALRPLGLRCVVAMIVDDSEEEIGTAVRQGLGRAPLVIVTGSLGPTEDDVTRQALSSLTGIELWEEPELLAAMSRRFNTPVEELRANLRIQTEVPVRGGYLANPHGTAAGLVFEAEGGLIVALPGPPRELQPMVLEQLVPYLAEKFGTRPVGGLLKVRFVGIGESAIADLIDRKVPIPNDVTVGSLFEGMRVDFYFSVPGSGDDDLGRLESLKEQMVAQLGDFIYATDTTTLESHVVELFVARGQTLALAEVGSGGTVAAGLTGADAAADVLVGAYSAPNEERLRRLLGMPAGQDASDDAAAQGAIAERLAEATGAEGAGYMGPAREAAAGRRYVDVTVRRPDGRTATRPAGAGGPRDLARFNRTTQLLDLLRRQVRP